MNIYDKTAKRVSLQESPDGKTVGIAFFATNTGKNVPLSIEKHLITIPVDKSAFAELFFTIEDLIKQKPTDFGLEVGK